MTEPRYIDDPFEEEPQGRKKAKKLAGTTLLQKMALKATGRGDTGFRDNAQYKLFTDLEANAIGADSESRVWAAWIKWRIDQTAALNKKIINISMDKLIHNIGMDDKRKEWFVDHRTEVLKKPSAQEFRSKLEQNNVEVLKEMEKNVKNS